MSMPPELKERVRRFRFQHELNSEAEALRLLSEKGLQAFESREPVGNPRMAKAAAAGLGRRLALSAAHAKL